MSPPANGTPAPNKGLAFDLLNDHWPHGAIARSYGVFDDQLGCAVRGSFVVDADGKISWQVVNQIGEARQLSDVLAGWLVDWRERGEAMPLNGEYEPSPRSWVREQVERYEATDGREANTLRDTGLPVVIFTTRGRKSGKLRKIPLMRVEHDGQYAMVASLGGAPEHPEWYHNIKADPEALMVQDGADQFDAHARELDGEERAIWWQRAVQAYPPYAEYQQRTDRKIPVFLVERRA